MGDLSENFSRREFKCKCGCGFDDINPLIVQMCQDIRDMIGVPLRINSGCRCETHNKNVGSTSKNHVHGNAADLSSPNLSAKLLYNIAKDLYSQGKMVGLELALLEGTWLHIDCDRVRNNRFQSIK